MPVCCLGGLCSGAGCSKGISVSKAVLEKTWSCNKAADDDVQRQDYEAGILLHQRFLEKEPANTLALYHLGYGYKQTGDHEEEVLHYEKAISLGLKKYQYGLSYLCIIQKRQAISLPLIQF